MKESLFRSCKVSRRIFSMGWPAVDRSPFFGFIRASPLDLASAGLDGSLKAASGVNSECLLFSSSRRGSIFRSEC